MSIAVLAVVGSALAFKATQNNPVCVMQTIEGVCPVAPGDFACPIDVNVSFEVGGTKVCTTDIFYETDPGFCDPSKCDVIDFTVVD